MSTIDLIILGSLCQSPKSAYDLQKQIESRNLSRWIKIGSFTVYKKVVQYESKGYVISETVRVIHDSIACYAHFHNACLLVFGLE